MARSTAADGVASAPFISLKTTPLLRRPLFGSAGSSNSKRMPSCLKESSERRGKKVASRYTWRRFMKSLVLRVLYRYMVQSEPVSAFMNVDSERRVMLKNGSRTGNRCETARHTGSRLGV